MQATQELQSVHFDRLKKFQPPANDPKALASTDGQRFLESATPGPKPAKNKPPRIPK